MNCKNCIHWVFGRCTVSNLIVGPGQLCNAWELSQSHDFVETAFASFDEEELHKRVAELEAEVAELKPYRDGYDGYDDYPEEGETVIARLRNWVFLAQHRGDCWYDALGYKEKIRGEVERWWKLPEVQE